MLGEMRYLKDFLLLCDRIFLWRKEILVLFEKTLWFVDAVLYPLNTNHDEEKNALLCIISKHN